MYMYIYHILGQVLKYVDRCMINLGKNKELPNATGYSNTQIYRYTETQISQKNHNPNNVPIHDKESLINSNLCKRDSESESSGLHEEYQSDENLYLSCQICKCIFILFEPICTPSINTPHIPQGGGTSFKPLQGPAAGPKEGTLNKSPVPSNIKNQHGDGSVNLIRNIQPLNMYKKGKKEISSGTEKCDNGEQENAAGSSVLMLGN
jgi:hypothetical protein